MVPEISSFADTGAHRIRKITPDGKIQTIAGNGVVGFKGDGGPATAAELSIPQSLAIDANGNLYIADPPEHTIRKINPAGVITTFAGTPGGYGFAGDGGPANQARLYLPRAVAVDGGGNVWIADSANGRIREVTSNGVITTASDSGYSCSVWLLIRTAISITHPVIWAIFTQALFHSHRLRQRSRGTAS